MVHRLCLTIYVFLLGAWLLEHGFIHAGEIGTGVLVALGIVAVKGAFVWLAIWLLWPRKRQAR